MEKQQGNYQDNAGNAISGASLYVYDAGTTDLATIYSDDGVTAEDNPFLTDSEGRWAFYAADGDYDLKFVKSGYNDINFYDIQFLDRSGIKSSLASLTGATFDFIQDGTPTATAADEWWLETDTGKAYISTGSGTGNWSEQYEIIIKSNGYYLLIGATSDFGNQRMVRNQTILDQTTGPFYNFGGVSGYCSVPNNSQLNVGTNDFTILIRCRMYSAPSSAKQFLAKFDSGSGVGWYLRHETSGKILFRADDNTTDSDVETNSSVTNRIVKIGIRGIRDGNLGITIDGKIQTDTATCPPLTLSNTAIMIWAANSALSSFANIDILDGPYIINRLFTDDEIIQHTSNPQMALDYADEGGSNVAMNVSSFANSVVNPYDTFSGASATGYTAAHTGAGTQRAATADELVIKKGKKYLVLFTLAYTSGAYPLYNIKDGDAGNGITTNGAQTSTNGANSFIFTASSSTTGVVEFVNTTNASYAVSGFSIIQLGATAVFPGAAFGPIQAKDTQNGLIATVSGATLCNKIPGKVYPDEYTSIADNDTIDIPAEAAMLEIYINVATAQASTTIRIGTADGGEQVVADSTATDTAGMQKLTVLITDFTAADVLYIGSDGGAAWATLDADLYVKYTLIKGLR